MGIEEVRATALNYAASLAQTAVATGGAAYTVEGVLEMASKIERYLLQGDVPRAPPLQRAA